MTGAPRRAGRRSYEQHGPYVNPRLKNRPELVELEPPRPVQEVIPGSGWADGLLLDARAVVDGLDWFRVQGGFGSYNDREDYVAALPAGTLSVTGWDLERGDGDVIAGMRRAADRALAGTPQRVREAREALQREEDCRDALQNAVNERRYREGTS